MYQQPPPFQSNKRSSLQRHSNVGYHPYYSSSPLCVPTSNLHCASSSSTSSIASTSSSLQQVTSLKHEIQLSKNNIQQFNLNNSISCDESQNQTFNDDENDLSSISTRTNPPTTPASSTNNTPSNLNEETHCFKCKESRLINHQLAVENILNVTPVTSTSSASSVSNMKLRSQDKYSASCSSSCTTSSAVSTSSAQATYSRSSSTTSLNSFDIKSIHSSAASEYSCSNKKDKFTGFMTPSGYSDLPDSPGEIFPNTTKNLLINSSSLNNSASSQQRYQTKILNSIGLNEISVLTCDSNPSKSNDITIVEKTVLASTATSNSNNNTHLTGNFVNSEYSTFIQNDEDPNVNSMIDDDEKVIAYDVEGSLCGSTRSNISSLSFPQEPTADLAFIMNLLAKKSSNSVTNLNFAQMVDKKCEKQQQILFEQPQTRLWSNYSFNKTNSFTPPIKLKSDEIDSMNNKNLSIKTNKKLVYEDEENQTEEQEQLVTAEEDDDCTKSIASLPSDIVRDNDTINLNKTNFSALFNKLTNNLDLIKDTHKFVESSPLLANKMLSDANKKSNFSQNQLLDFGDTNNQSHNNQGNILRSNEKIAKKNEEDNDEKILQDFIDEMLPIALANNKQTENDYYEQDSLNEYDEAEMHRYQQIYQNNDLHNHVPLCNILPKIDEENEDEYEDRTMLPVMKNIKRTINSGNFSKSVVVQMTKTSMLRVNKVLQKKSNSMSINTTSTIKRSSNQIKDNLSGEKRQVLSNSSSMNSIQSKSSNSSLGLGKKVALTPSKKFNKNQTVSTIKRPNTINK